MTIKLSKKIIERGIRTGLEKEFEELNLGTDKLGIARRVKYLAGAMKQYHLKEIAAVRLTNGKIVRISDVPYLEEENLHEVYRKLYTERSRDIEEAL